jgi:hypothetical protein
VKHGSASRVSARAFERLFGGQRVGLIDTLWRMRARRNAVVPLSA